MGRRLFEEYGYTHRKLNIVPIADFKKKLMTKKLTEIDPDQAAHIISHAESVLGKSYPVLLASDFRMYVENGNRSIYEGKCFERRVDLLMLALAEAIELKGRFTDAVVDLLWMILEESTWIIPAHCMKKNAPEELRERVSLPQCVGEDEYYIDLFSAATGASLAVVYHFCHDIFDKVNPVLNKRLLHEIDRRILRPFMNEGNRRQIANWTGLRGDRVNNWNPWIISNILITCSLVSEDIDIREAVVTACLPMLDCFTSFYQEDGACNEGPGYWDAAGAAYFDALQILYKMTDGDVCLFQEPLVRKMGEYEVKVVVHDEYVLSFADGAGKLCPNPVVLYNWGVLCNSEMMKSFGQNRLNGEVPKIPTNTKLFFHPYRVFCHFAMDKLPKCAFVAPEKFWFDGVVIAGSREKSVTDQGLFLALKGGHNGESHNHNDVGNVLVYGDGKPIFLDAGSGTYTKRTFSDGRYTIWSMCSDYHNVATINGITQEKGAKAHSCDHVYEEKSGKLTMNLKYAYPETADIASYTRSAVLKDSRITITDDIALNHAGDIMFSFICESLPELKTQNCFTLHGFQVSFDDSLEFACEALDKTWPETETIPTKWGVDVLYRITLRNRKPIKAHTYVIEVKR